MSSNTSQVFSGFGASTAPKKLAHRNASAVSFDLPTGRHGGGAATGRPPGLTPAQVEALIDIILENPTYRRMLMDRMR